MTFDQYWDRLVQRNPAMRDESTKMTLTVSSFKDSLRQTFNVGHEHGVASARWLHDLAKPGNLGF